MKIFKKGRRFFKMIIAFIKGDKKQYNNLKNKSEFKEQKIILKSVPVNYIIGTSNICNLECPLCITGLRKQEKPLKFMDFELFTQIVDKIKNYAELVQLYNWGEPLLHKELPKMLEYCNKFDLNTEISSNLSLKNIDEKLEVLVKFRLKRLIVSFDGVTQEDYSRYRRTGCLEDVINNIKKINEFKEKYNSIYPIISLQFLKNKHTKDQIDNLKANYKSWGANDYYVCDMTTIFKDRDLETAKEWFDEETIQKRKYLDIDTNMHKKVCYFLYTTMIIDQDGSIPSCCFATEIKDDFGVWDNKKTIAEMYNSEEFVKARKMFKSKEPCEDSTCSDCTVFLTYKKAGKING